jgi:DNA polymerase III alpha subunit
VFDGLSYPDEHIKFVTSEEQGMDAWALTDHGNGNGLAHAHSAASKLQKKGKKYRQLYGVEFYFVPSLSQWKLDYENNRQEIKDAKTAAEMEKKSKVKTDIDAGDDSDEEAGGHTVEDEAETKSDDYKEKPEWQKRYHLVAVAKNREGLSNINRLVKLSFKDGFYRFPRIDFELLRKYGKGIIWSTACIGGRASGIILRGESEGKSSDEIITQLENMSDQFVDAVGKENFFLELQFNKLPKQHTVNKYLITLSRKTGIPLIATADSHYPDPSKWQARELYKKLGWMGKKLDATVLPKLEDLKCELYPKNAIQMWEEYKKGYSEYDFYGGTEIEVRDAIERTHDIAWGMCEDTWVDTKPKLPHFGTPEKSAMKQLVELLMIKMKEQGYSDNEKYVARLREELEVIKAKQFADYFLTLYKIFEKSSKRCLSGAARGSGSGSLINYLLEITHSDPIKYDLLFSRFINMGRKGFPDVDCLHEDHLVILSDSSKKRLCDIVQGDVVMGGDGRRHVVLNVYKRALHDLEPPMIVFVKDSSENLGAIRCVPRHKFVLDDGSVIYANELMQGNKLKSKELVSVHSIVPDPSVNSLYVDITVDEDHMFTVVPFDVIEDEGQLSSNDYYSFSSNFEFEQP